MNVKKEDNQSLGHFKIALISIFLIIIVFSLGFISEKNGVSGFATFNGDSSYAGGADSGLREFKDVSSLKSLAPGNYYLDDAGTVYWIDDSSSPAIAKVKFIYESQKNRHIYIDKEGNLGYVVS